MIPRRVGVSKKYMATTPPGPPPPGPPPGAPPKGDPNKFQNTPIFMAVINELNVNSDQLQKRQKLITDIETALTPRYGCANRLITYVLRFGHARTLMN